MQTRRQLFPLGALYLMVACSGGGTTPTTPTTPTPPTTPTVTNLITITAQGVSPSNIQITVRPRVTFLNNDSRSHNMASDPHPQHTTCPELNSVGFLSPGQSRESGNLNIARTCEFHDHDNPGTTSLNGTVTIK